MSWIGPFFKFKVYVNETDYFNSNFYKNLDDLKWKNTEKIKDIRKSKFNINENFFNAIASMYLLTWKSGKYFVQCNLKNLAKFV